jgi:hypothetical protein
MRPLRDPHAGWLRRSQSGQAIVIVAIMIVVLLAGVGLAIDGGYGYVQNQAAEKAAAAGALSGVVYMPYQFAGGTFGGNNATDRARLEASRNGFADNCPVPCTIKVTPSPVAGRSNQLKVTVEQLVPTFFMTMFGFPNYWVRQEALASLLPPLQIGQPGGELGSSASELGSPGHFYYLRNEGWTTNRGEGDAYTPIPSGCGASCDSSDVHQISYQNGGRDFGASNMPPGSWWTLSDRGGWNFRIYVPPGKHVQVEIYNAAFAPDQGSHCDNTRPTAAGGPPGPPSCNTASANYHMHENDGTFNFNDRAQYQVMLYSLFRANNEYVRTADSLIQQTRVWPVDARSRWTSTPQYAIPGNPPSITQTFAGPNPGDPATNMRIYHDWIDINNYNEPAPNQSLVECNAGAGPASCALPGAYLDGGVQGQTFRLRVDNLDSAGNIPSGSCCPGAGHKAYAIRLKDITSPPAVICATGCQLGALADLAIFTPFQNTANAGFTMPIFQLPPDYRGRTLQLFVFDPGDISTNGGQLDLGITDPSVTGPCRPNCLANLSNWSTYNLGCQRVAPNTCGSGVVGRTNGPTSGPVSIFAANGSSHPYDNYWLLYNLPINSAYDPGPDPNNWWWGLQYFTSNSVTSQDTITLTLSALGSPAHLCVPNPPQC